MGQFKDATIKEVVEGINESFFLPDIQREFVWLSNPNEHKIEKLFDSILRGYPIGSFLFWNLKRTDIETDRKASENADKLNFQLYKFIEDYDIRKPHNEKIDIAKVNSNDLHIVLDGQQRLTSLYIGLRGSRTLKLPHVWWNNPHAFEKRTLYFNVRYVPSDEDTEDCYQFEFKASDEIPTTDGNNYWVKVGDLLSKSSLDFAFKDHLSMEETLLLNKLESALTKERIISYYEETEKSLDKVLRIFIRVNSGGTKLSYSDLLMSILTSNFSSDIRGFMNDLIDSYAQEGFSNFGRDQVLKTSLLLIGSNAKFTLKNFNRTNIHLIEQSWDNLVNKMSDAIHIVKELGYANNLSSGYIITVISLYLYSKGLGYATVNKSKADIEAIGRFVRIAQIKSYFSSSLDSKLGVIADNIKLSADFTQFNERMANDNRERLRLTKDDIDDILLNLQYGNAGTLPILQMLYPNLDYKNRSFHIDHIYPKSKFNATNKELPETFLWQQNFLFNLQLLEGSENIEKSNEDPDKWVSDYFGGDMSKINAYKEQNYISPSMSLKWADISNFRTDRENNIRKALYKIIEEQHK